jgi:hypothetical protein
MQEFSQLNDIMNSPYPKQFFKVLSPIHDIVIDKSIFIFHPINTLYILLQEVPRKTKREPQSILKTRKNDDSFTKKKVSLKIHPDKGGSSEAMNPITKFGTRKRRT